MQTVSRRKAILLAASALSICAAAPAYAQDANEGDMSSSNEIIVTAQRVEQRLQDVPISITVFDQAKLDSNNVTSARDLAAYTPGLSVSTRYGNDSTTFTIRGFSQEQRTTSTVATYFADVVAPRGSGVDTGGDGAGPGQLFDLQNVQVLKGPQGTLFGRNTTGGAVLLVPKKPTDKLEGYIEGSVGRFDLRRVQAVLNVPVMDTLRVRVGIDRNVRDGYLKNIGLGRKDLGNVDYWSGRFSMVADLSPDIENYTIASYTKSKSAGITPKLIRAFPSSDNPFVTPYFFGMYEWDGSSTTTLPGLGTVPLPSRTWGDYAQDQIDRESGRSPWTVENSLPGSYSRSEQWQIINTTTWQASDSVTVKNNFSYAEFRSALAMDLYGSFFPLPGLTADEVMAPEQVLTFVPIIPESSSGHSNAESSLVEELQFQGRAVDGRLNWQAGLYYETNRPLGPSGSQSPNYTPCADSANFVCNPKATVPTVLVATSAGVMSWSQYRTQFRSMAAYAQASYDITDQLTLSAGIRYTSDKSSSNYSIERIVFPTGGGDPYVLCSNTGAPNFSGNTNTGLTLADRFTACKEHISKSSKKPTWMIGLDYKPLNNVMLYAKYTRGYRQGAVAPAAPDGYNTYDPEKVDTYEIGAKTSWRGAVPGTFNISGFYNNFQNQQLQVGLFSTALYTGPTTYIGNVGKSRIYGFEAEATVSPFEGLNLAAAYAYLNSKVQEVGDYDVPAGYRAGGLPVVGAELPFAMKHKLTVDASYTLPLPNSIGKITIGGNLVYQSKYRVGLQTYQWLPHYTYGNVNVTWADIAGKPIDASLFVTNVTNKVMYTNLNDQSSAFTGAGFVSGNLAEPRIWGLKLRYRFGE